MSAMQRLGSSKSLNGLLPPKAFQTFHVCFSKNHCIRGRALNTTSALEVKHALLLYLSPCLLCISVCWAMHTPNFTSIMKGGNKNGLKQLKHEIDRITHLKLCMLVLNNCPGCSCFVQDGLDHVTDVARLVKMEPCPGKIDWVQMRQHNGWGLECSPAGGRQNHNGWSR